MPELERVGAVGIGKGSSARPRPLTGPSMNATIRAAGGVRRLATMELAAQLGEDVGEIA
jgi:hypothetical protein